MESRGNALAQLRKSLRSGRKEELPVEKVSVMADSKEGLEKGLEKAKELMKSGIPEKMESAAESQMGSEDPMESESHSHEMDSDLDGCSMEELKSMIMEMRKEKR